MFECPVCGSGEVTTKPWATWPPPDIANLAPPYEDSLGPPSYEICPTCGLEFGNDDNPGTVPPSSFEQYRAEWQADGAKRFDVQ